MRTSALFDAKNFEFFEIYVVPAQKGRGEFESLRIFFGQVGEGDQFFAILYGRPLWTAPNYTLGKLNMM